MSDQNIVFNFFELVNARDLKRLGDLLTDTAEFYFPKTRPLIGKITPAGLKIMDIKDLSQAVEDLKIEIGVITTPPSAAQPVADLFMKAQVNAILNFSPTRISVPEYCLVENIDFTVKLDMISYELHHETGT